MELIHDLLRQTSSTPSCWRHILSILCDQLKLRSAHLLMVHRQNKIIRFHFEGGEAISDSDLDAYRDHWIFEDPSFILPPSYHFLSLNELAWQEYLGCAFFKEYLQPQGVYCSGNMTLLMEGQWQLLFAVNTNMEQGKINQDSANLLHEFGLMFKQAIVQAFNYYNNDYFTLLVNQTLKSNRLPSILFSEYGEILGQNQLYDIWSSQNKIDQQSLIEQKLDQQLYLRIFQISSLYRGRDYKFPTEIITYQCRNGEMVKIALQASFQQVGDIRFNAVLVSVIDVSCLSPISTSRVKQLFNLSDQEAKLCQYLQEHINVEQIAGFMLCSVREITVLEKHLYRKTGTENKHQLLSMLLAIPETV